MNDLLPSNCPYCSCVTTYAWRQKKIGHAPMGVMAGVVIEPSLEAVEIYCTKCNKTLSITPIMKSRD